MSKSKQAGFDNRQEFKQIKQTHLDKLSKSNDHPFNKLPPDKQKEVYDFQRARQEELRIRVQSTMLVQDTRDQATLDSYSSLNESEYLDATFKEMKALYNQCDFVSRKNSPMEMHGCSGIPLNGLHWPVDPSQLFDFDKHFAEAEVNADTETGTGAETGIKTEIQFHIPHHNMSARHAGSFHIKNAVIRARFVGDESSHAFFIGEHDKLSATVFIGCDNDGELFALMVDGRIPESQREKFSNDELDTVTIRHDVAELEEFMMLAVTDGRYYKRYMEPRALSEDLAIFTCYNKARKLHCDTVASFTHGLCDPETIFDGSDAMDVLTEWAKNLPESERI